MRGHAGSVAADTASATVVSNDLELLLLPPGNHAGPDGSPAQVDGVTATGRVTVSSQGRRGTGERLVYSSRDRSIRAYRDRRESSPVDRSGEGNGQRHVFDFQ